MRVTIASVAVLCLCAAAYAQSAYGYRPSRHHHIVDVITRKEPVQKQSSGCGDCVPIVWSSVDIDEAIKLAVSDQDLPDASGLRCWKIWRPAAVAMEHHRLPKVVRTAADIQTARLVSLALKKLSTDKECTQISEVIQTRDPGYAPLLVSAVTPHRQYGVLQ